MGSLYVEAALRRLRGQVAGGVQTPCIWTGNNGESRAAYELNARVVKVLGKHEGNGGAPVGEPPDSYEEDTLPFCSRQVVASTHN